MSHRRYGLIATLLTIGCAEPTVDAPVALPASRPLATDVIAVQVVDDDLYWVEQPADVVGVSLRLRRWRAGAVTTIDEIARADLFEQFQLFVLVRSGSLAWGLADSHGTCGTGRLLRAGRAAEDLTLLTVDGRCRALPLDLSAAGLWFAAPIVGTTDVEYRSLDFAAGEGPLLARRQGWRPSPSILARDHVYTMELGADGAVGRVLEFDRAGALTDQGDPIARPGGLVATATAIQWIDNGSFDGPARLVESTGRPPVTIVAELPSLAHSLAATDDARWAIPGLPGAGSSTLLQLRGAEATSYQVDRPVQVVVGLHDQLFMIDDTLTPVRGGGLWQQPLE